MPGFAEPALSVVAGALTTLSPCVFPLLPVIVGGALVSAFALGGLLGLVWSPCAGPLLGSTLALVATAGGAPRGALLLGLFGLGAALPLVGAAYASRAGFGRMRAWVLAHASATKRVMGGSLLLVGVLILSGGDHAIEAWVNDRLPDAWLAITTRI